MMSALCCQQRRPYSHRRRAVACLRLARVRSSEASNGNSHRSGWVGAAEQWTPAFRRGDGKAGDSRIPSQPLYAGTTKISDLLDVPHQEGRGGDDTLDVLSLGGLVRPLA